MRKAQIAQYLGEIVQMRFSVIDLESSERGSSEKTGFHFLAAL
jgi:hypothetical protein